jgi:hypothetical protein
MHAKSTSLQKALQYLRIGVPIGISLAGLCNLWTEYQLAHDVGHLTTVVSYALPGAVELTVSLSTYVWAASDGEFRKAALRYALSAQLISMILVWLDHAITLWHTGWHLAVTEFVAMVPTLIAVLLMFLERDTARALEHVASSVAAADAVAEADELQDYVPRESRRVPLQPSEKDIVQEPADRRPAAPVLQAAQALLLQDPELKTHAVEIAQSHGKSERWGWDVRAAARQLQSANA